MVGGKKSKGLYFVLIQIISYLNFFLEDWSASEKLFICPALIGSAEPATAFAKCKAPAVVVGRVWPCSCIRCIGSPADFKPEMLDTGSREEVIRSKKGHGIILPFSRCCRDSSFSLDFPKNISMPTLIADATSRVTPDCVLVLAMEFENPFE